MNKLTADWKEQKSIEEMFIGSALVLGSKEFKIHAISLQKEDFCDKKLGEAFDYLVRFVNEGRDFDAAILNNEMKWLGSVYLTDIINGCLTPSRIGDYAKQVRENSIRRKFLKHLSESNGKATSDVIAAVQKDIWSFQSSSPSTWKIEEGLSRMLNKIEQNMAGNIEYPTGLIDLDRVIGGFQRGDVIILAGRPSSGKTAMAVNICMNFLKTNKKILYVDLETSDIHMLQRFVGLSAKVPVSRMKAGNLIDFELEKIVKASSELAKLPLVIRDDTNTSVADIMTQARSIKADFIVLDYIHIMAGGGSEEDDNKRLGHLIRGLKAVAMELKIPVMVLSQLNRSLEHRVDKKPQLADLRDSGSLEQVGDVICAMYWAYKYDSTARFNESMIRVLKQKTGSAEDVLLYWSPEIMEFKNYSPPKEQEQEKKKTVFRLSKRSYVAPTSGGEEKTTSEEKENEKTEPVAESIDLPGIEQ